MIKLIDSPPVFGSTIFCDDVRLEQNGKFIYVGVYRGPMVIHVPFPVRLPTFAFAITFRQKATMFDPNATFRIFLPGDPDDSSSDEASVIAEMGETIPGAFSRAARENSDKAGIPMEDREWMQASTTLQFRDFEIKEPGQIKVRADVGGNRYRLGALRVVGPQKD